MLVGATALVAWATGWQPASVADLAASVPVVVFGGISLAAVFRAIDRTGFTLVRRGEIVGRKARAVLHRLARLEAIARRGRVDLARASALHRALAAASDPEIAPWIPADVRGRAELLLARVIVVTSGPVAARGRRGVGEVRALLERAAEHLDDAAPARADLAEIARIPERASRSSQGAVPPDPRGRALRSRLPPIAGARRGVAARDDVSRRGRRRARRRSRPHEGLRAGRW